MKCYNPLTITKNLDYNLYPRGIEVRCGKCLNCLADRAMTKGMRVMHEAEADKEYKIYFLTFTYDDKHVKRVNGYMTLSKKDTRKKRDKIYSRLYRKAKKHNKEYHKMYKYMIAGEYGEKGTERPHYHMVLLIKKYKSKILHEFIKEFKGGRYEVEEAETKKAIFYTSGYTAKKIGQRAKIKEIEEPFIMCSKGLGKNWALKNARMLLGRGYCYIPVAKGVGKKEVPKIYTDWILQAGLWTEEEYENFYKEKREKANRDNEKKINEIVSKAHKQITGREFSYEDDTRISTKIIYDTFDGITNVYMNYLENNKKNQSVRWRNTIWEQYKKGLARIRHYKAVQKLLEKKKKKEHRYVEYNTTS